MCLKMVQLGLYNTNRKSTCLFPNKLLAKLNNVFFSQRAYSTCKKNYFPLNVYMSKKMYISYLVKILGPKITFLHWRDIVM